MRKYGEKLGEIKCELQLPIFDIILDHSLGMEYDAVEAPDFRFALSLFDLCDAGGFLEVGVLISSGTETAEKAYKVWLDFPDRFGDNKPLVISSRIGSGFYES
ncbi:MAG: hypothetical protein QNK37_07300 [Acidobacteriota bacterium]|nr:hypothetical protein [Acidobacteriota bacterium]